MTTDGKIRVLRVIARMNVGGPAWQSSVLTRGLPQHGIETRLLVGRVGSQEEDFLTLREPDLPATEVRGLGRSVRFGDDIRAFFALIHEIRRFRPHVVHTHTAKAGVLGRLAAIVCRVPFRVHTFHGHVLHGYFPVPVAWIIRVTERLLARWTSVLVSVGDRVQDELMAAGIGRSRRWVAIAPGVAPPREVTREDARHRMGVDVDVPVLLFVGRVTSVKRVDRLLQAVRLVVDRLPDVTLVVAGAGDALEEIRRQAGVLGDSVRFLGWCPDVDLLYAGSDLVVIASDNEGMPVTLIEAAMAGVPGVTTDVGSASEVVEDGVTGLVVAPDHRCLAEAVIDLLEDPERRRTMGLAAHRRAVERFGSDRLVADHVDLYRSLAGDSSTGLIAGSW